MNRLKELIILKKELEKEVENMKSDNVNCMKKTFLTQERQTKERKKYFYYIDQKNNLKKTKKRIIITFIISLIIIFLTLLTSFCLAVSFSTAINMLIFKLVADIIILGQSLISIAITANNIIKYNETKNNINYNLNEIKLNLSKLEHDLKSIDEKHVFFCRQLNIKEDKIKNIDNIINNTLFNEKSVINKSNLYIEKYKNKQRVRIP